VPSRLVLAVLCAVCGLSFFVYAFGRRALTGNERLILLEHVWFAGVLRRCPLGARFRCWSTST
jgi:hypothetical protein